MKENFNAVNLTKKITHKHSLQKISFNLRKLFKLIFLFLIGVNILSRYDGSGRKINQIIKLIYLCKEEEVKEEKN